MQMDVMVGVVFNSEGFIPNLSNPLEAQRLEAKRSCLLAELSRRQSSLKNLVAGPLRYEIHVTSLLRIEHDCSDLELVTFERRRPRSGLYSTSCRKIAVL